MKLVWTETNAGRSVLSLEAESHQDEPPFLRELILDARLDARPPERLWVAAALCFGHGLAGAWSGDILPGRLVERAIEKYLGPGIAFGAQVQEETRDWNTSGGSCYVQVARGKLGATLEGADTCDFTMEIRDLGDWVGRLYSIDRIVVASNAFLHVESPYRSSSFGPFLAVAVLLSTELHMDQIVIPTDLVLDSEQELFSRAKELCRTVGLSVIVK